MVLVNAVNVIELVHLHIQGLLVLPQTLHFGHELVTCDLVTVDIFKHELDALILVKVLGFADLCIELFSGLLELGDLGGDLLLHVFLAFVGLFASLT